MDSNQDFHIPTNEPPRQPEPAEDAGRDELQSGSGIQYFDASFAEGEQAPRKTLLERLSGIRDAVLRAARSRGQRSDLGRVSGQNEEKKRQQRNFALVAALSFGAVLVFVWLGSGPLRPRSADPEVRFARTDFRVGPDSLDKQAFQSQYEERLDAISTQLKGTNETIGKLSARIAELNGKPRPDQAGAATPAARHPARLPDFPDTDAASLTALPAKPVRPRLAMVDVAPRSPEPPGQASSHSGAYRRGLRSGWDEPIARNRARHESARSYIPAGSFMRGTVLSGVTAPTGGNAAQNPIPMLLEVTDLARLPNAFRARVKRCFVTANAAGDLSSERVWVRLDRMSCMRENGKALDVRVQGYVTGDDGKTGMRARLVTRSGQAIANALFLGTVSGLGKAVSLSAQNTTTYSSGAQSSSVNNPWKAGFGEGVDTASDRIISYYLKLADKIFPVLEIDSGRKVDIVFSQGVTLGEEPPPAKPAAAPVQDVPGANSSLVFGRAMKERNNDID